MVKPSFVRANDIHFDENLGLGSKFPSCEENLFVYQALKTGDSKSEFYDVPVARHTLNLQSRDIDFHGRYAAQGYLVRRLEGVDRYIAFIVFFIKSVIFKRNKYMKYFMRGFRS